MGIPELAVIVMTVVMVALAVVPAARICGKAGFPMWLGILAIVPVANVVLAFFLAFAKWPIEKEIEAFREARPPAR